MASLKTFLEKSFSSYGVTAADRAFLINAAADSKGTKIGKNIGRSATSVLLAIATFVEFFALTLPFAILVGVPYWVVKGGSPEVVAKRLNSNDVAFANSIRGIFCCRPMHAAPPIGEAIPLVPRGPQQ